MSKIPLREHVDALFERDRSALDVASSEREKSAQALAGEREKAAQALAVQRDKTAEALATALERQIEQGDAALQEHINQQIAQIRAALISADLLELERIAALRATVVAGDTLSRERLDSAQREMGLSSSASAEAIAKAEAATEKRFESVNEFRAQLADQGNTFLPREVADTQFAELRKTLQEISARLDRAEGNRTGSSERRAEQRLSNSAVVGVIGAAVAFLALVVLVANMAFGG